MVYRWITCQYRNESILECTKLVNINFGRNNITGKNWITVVIPDVLNEYWLDKKDAINVYLEVKSTLKLKGNPICKNPRELVESEFTQPITKEWTNKINKTK